MKLTMWAFSGWTAVFMAAISTAVGVLVRALLAHLSSGPVPQRYSMKELAGFGLGGALLSFLAALVSLGFWLLLGVRPVPFIWAILHIVIVTSAGVLSTYVGGWIAMHLLKKR
jgi:hypothetical protein